MARAARLYPGRGYEEAARHGYAFLTEVMWDSAETGFFTIVERGGKSLQRGRRHPHGHTYAIQAFIELAPLVGEATARRWTQRTFEWLENVAWDRSHGGYYGYYERDNRRVVPDGLAPDFQLDWIGTPLGLKDFNVLQDAFAALTAITACDWDARAASRLDWHVRLFLDRLLRFKLIPHYYSADWSPVPDIPRSGQSMQLIASLLTATARSAEGVAACKLLATICAQFFAHRDGGYSFARSINPWVSRGVDLRVPERLWWVQAEACRGWLRLALLCPDDAACRTAFARQWVFVEDRLVDPRYHGFYESAEDGDSAQLQETDQVEKIHKTHIWKDVSHEAHMLMDAVEWLRTDAGSCLA